MRILGLSVAAVSLCPAILPGANVRLSRDVSGGYVSVYTLATGAPYTDAVLGECSIARGRQNEPAVAVNPRNAQVLLGSSNDYCGVYAGSTTQFVPSGPIWLGYYRSEDGGATFRSSLVPGYPGDTSPYAALSAARTASAGDPVIAWDRHGRVFFGAESSDDPSGSKKTLGDIWVARFDNPDGEGGDTLNDGRRYLGTSIVARGSSAPNLLGKFNDKTSLEADRTGGACDGNVYFAWSRFTGVAGGSNIYFSRSTDHGVTWSQPALLTSNTMNVQDPDIAVTGNGHVYVTFGQGSTRNGQPDAVGVSRSTDCGRTFGKPVVVATFTPYNAMDISVSGSPARDCGDFANACRSGYTFFRRTTAPRSSADQLDAPHEWVYIVYEATKPGTEVDTGTTYGSIRPGRGSQSAVYFVKLDGSTGTASSPVLLDNQSVGHQFFPDISADGGVLHAIWWDSRMDTAYSATRPVGNTAAGVVGPALDVFGTKSSDGGATWATPSRLTEVSTNPDFEQFSDRTVPFAGDYLWVTSKGDFAFVTWTDWRDTVAGPDPRESVPSSADVFQCRILSPTGWSGDQCPRDGGLDQNIYGNVAP